MKNLLLVCIVFLFNACVTPVSYSKEKLNVLVVLAHPDDETWISGTLAKMSSLGLTIVPIYLTSGDRGTDRSGLGLTGDKLAKMRETEAINASKTLGLTAPIFMRLPDGQVKSNLDLASKQLESLNNQYKPVMVLTFDPLGITGNKDHKMVSKITTQVFDTKVIYFTISKERAENFTQFAKRKGLDFKIKNPVTNNKITTKIDVANFSNQRINAMKQHNTQFVPILISVFSEFISLNTMEEVLITDNQTRLIFDKYISGSE